MSVAIQSRNRLQIRQSIGRNLGIVVIGAATSSVDSASLLDTKYLRGGDDAHNEKQVMIFDPAGSIVAGEISWVSDYAGSTHDATVSPAFTAAIAVGDDYEMWDTPWTIEDINDVINQVIMDVTPNCLQDLQTDNNYIAQSTYEHNWLSSFVGIHKVEYLAGVGTEHVVHSCETVWDELVDADVTASVDTTLFAEGDSLKLVAAAGLGAGDIMATEDITALDISQCDKLEIWVYSSVALAAGDLQVLLDNTAQCASAVESLDIPATTANTKTRHVISLANPQNDSAIISVGIKQVTDKGAFTLYVRDIRAVNSMTRQWKELNPNYWGISRGSTKYLQLASDGLSLAGTAQPLRISGYDMPALLTNDSTNSEIDPDYLIAAAMPILLMTHAKSRSLDIEDRPGKAAAWAKMAQQKKVSIGTDYAKNTRFF